MFTGLIEELGKVREIRREGADWFLTVACGFDMGTVKPGDSIAVSGACLTVVAKGAGDFTVQVSAETVQRTTFATLAVGDGVNLERAMPMGGRLDGHLVQGHVDAVGRVERVNPRGRSVEIWFRVPADAGRYIVPKGSIAIEGVSLTVNQVEDGGDGTRFSINLIPHTQTKTTLARLMPGTGVNVETDILGRYVERLLRGRVSCPAEKVDEDFLRRHGFA